MPLIQIKRRVGQDIDPWGRVRHCFATDVEEDLYHYFVTLYDIANWNFCYQQCLDNSNITFENLNNNGDVGTGADQVARGDHSHANLPTDDQKGALDTALLPDSGNPFVVWDQFSDHSNRHRPGGADEVVLSVVRVTSTPYTMTISDDIVFVNTDTGDKIVKLPAGTQGYGHRIVNVGTSGNDVILTPDGLELLNGLNAVETLSDGESLEINYEITEGWY